MYEIDAVLRKFSTDERINLGLSVVPPDYNTNPEASLIIMAIGTDVVSGQLEDAYREYAVKKQQEMEQLAEKIQNMYDELEASGVATQATESLTYIATAYGYTRVDANDGNALGYTGSGGLGQKLRIYKDSTGKRVALFMNSYLGRFSQSQFPDDKHNTYICAYIKAYQLGMRRIGSATHIGGIDSYTGGEKNNESTTNLWSVLESVIHSVLSFSKVYSVCYAALEKMFEGTKASTTVQILGAHSYVHVACAPIERVNFDNTTMYCAFNIDTSGGVAGTYDVYSYLTYFIDFLNYAVIVRTTTAESRITVSP